MTVCSDGYTDNGSWARLDLPFMLKLVQKTRELSLAELSDGQTASVSKLSRLRRLPRGRESPESGDVLLCGVSLSFSDAHVALSERPKNCDSLNLNHEHVRGSTALLMSLFVEICRYRLVVARSI